MTNLVYEIAGTRVSTLSEARTMASIAKEKYKTLLIPENEVGVNRKKNKDRYEKIKNKFNFC